ncbi:diiron oxygenase [Sorangium sp. So ce291]|uniref:diiron oxygenase n=1 Tax=Sorangium sp. So ce291 TaxID=3133294 RepID=UPI003F5D9880
MGNSIVDRICRNWSTMSTVRNGEFVEVPEPSFDPEMHDFPRQLLPFRNHPEYASLDESVHRRIESFAWVSWNKRVVDTEERVVSPALAALMSGGTDIRLKGSARMAIRQALVDEYFHSHMHDVAVGITARGRDLPVELTDRLNRPACVYRSYAKTAERLESSWEKDLARLAWCVVGELSIYEFLGRVSEDETIQPSSRTLLKLHERDEAAHASLVAQVMRDHFSQFSTKQRDAFINYLPLAMDGFSQEDWLVWQDILEVAGVASAKQIVSDVQNDRCVPGHLPLLRSFKRVEDFCNDLGFELPSMTN